MSTEPTPRTELRNKWDLFRACRSAAIEAGLGMAARYTYMVIVELSYPHDDHGWHVQRTIRSLAGEVGMPKSRTWYAFEQLRRCRLVHVVEGVVRLTPEMGVRSAGGARGAPRTEREALRGRSAGRSADGARALRGQSASAPRAERPSISSTDTDKTQTSTTEGPEVDGVVLRTILEAPPKVAAALERDDRGKPIAWVCPRVAARLAAGYTADGKQRLSWWPGQSDALALAGVTAVDVIKWARYRCNEASASSAGRFVRLYEEPSLERVAASLAKRARAEQNRAAAASAPPPPAPPPDDAPEIVTLPGESRLEALRRQAREERARRKGGAR